MSQRELEQRVRMILDENVLGGCCSACSGSGIVNSGLVSKGGVRKGEKAPQHVADARESGKQVYLQYMRDLKSQGMSHQEALARWRTFKQGRPSTPLKKIRPALKKQPVVVRAPEKKLQPKLRPAPVKTRNCTRTKCERMYGRLGMVPQGQNVNSEELMHRLQDEIVDDIRMEPEPNWGEQDQIRQALEYYPDEDAFSDTVYEDEVYEEPDTLPAPFDDAASDTVYEDEISDTEYEDEKLTDADYRGIFGDGRKTKSRKSKSQKPKSQKPKSKKPRDMTKLREGQQRYRDFMSCMKGQGLNHKESLQLYREMKATKGSGWFDDFSKGFMMPFEAASKVAPLAALVL